MRQKSDSQPVTQGQLKKLMTGQFEAIKRIIFDRANATDQKFDRKINELRHELIGRFDLQDEQLASATIEILTSIERIKTDDIKPLKQRVSKLERRLSAA